MTLDPKQTVRDFVVRHPELREPLESLGIDYCCGGARPLGPAAEAAGKTWEEVRQTLEAAHAEAQRQPRPTDWSAASATALADHILTTHHVFTKAQLDRLDPLLAKVQRAHAREHGGLLDGVRRLFGALAEELRAHLWKEEQILFPSIKALDAFVAGTGQRPELHCGRIEHPIRQMLVEHDHAGDALAELRRITAGYRLPADACPSFAALYDGLQALERDLHEHIHLENNILFPTSVEQERSLD